MIYTNIYGTQLTLLNKEDISDLYSKSCFYVTAFYDYPNEYIVAYGFTDEPTAVEYSRLITKMFLLRTRVYRSVMDSKPSLSSSEDFRYDSGYLYTDCLKREAILSKKNQNDLDTCIQPHQYNGLNDFDDLFSL